MNYYKKINQDKYSKIFLPKIDGFKYNYMEKLTDNHIILVGQKIANVNHNIAYLIFVEVDKNTIKKGFEKEVNVKENEKICIKKIFDFDIGENFKGYDITHINDKANTTNFQVKELLN